MEETSAPLPKKNPGSAPDFITVEPLSVIRTSKGQSEVFVLETERGPYKRGHHDDVSFMTPLTVLSVQ